MSTTEYEQDVDTMDHEKERSVLAWRYLQLEDPVLKHLLVESGVKPEMSTKTQELQLYIREWDKLCMQDRILHRALWIQIWGQRLLNYFYHSQSESKLSTVFMMMLGNLGRNRTLKLGRLCFFGTRWQRMLS